MPDTAIGEPVPMGSKSPLFNMGCATYGPDLARVMESAYPYAACSSAKPQIDAIRAGRLGMPPAEVRKILAYYAAQFPEQTDGESYVGLMTLVDAALSDNSSDEGEVPDAVVRLQAENDRLRDQLRAMQGERSEVETLKTTLGQLQNKLREANDAKAVAEAEAAQLKQTTQAQGTVSIPPGIGFPDELLCTSNGRRLLAVNLRKGQELGLTLKTISAFFGRSTPSFLTNLEGGTAQIAQEEIAKFCKNLGIGLRTFAELCSREFADRELIALFELEIEDEAEA